MTVPLSGNGEHVWVQVRKTGANTEWAAGRLAQAAGISARQVGYAGLKDRHAVTTQWFSLHLPGKADPAFTGLHPALEILDQQRHDRKLQRGTLAGNHFILTVKQCSGNTHEALTICQQISQHGLPNYYGNQRFGLQGNNLQQAHAWFNGDIRPRTTHQASLYLSAARSWLFNHILQQRVQEGTWNRALAGDVFMLEGSQSWFADDATADLPKRVQQLALHPTGALWGKGELPSGKTVQALEAAQAARLPVLCNGLEQHGLRQERRPLRVRVTDMQAEMLDSATLRLAFTLPAGSYATVLLEQLGSFEESPTRKEEAGQATTARPVPE